MSKAAEELYKRVCEARVETWKKDLEEDMKVRDLFLEAGRKAFDEAGTSCENIKTTEDSK